MKEMYDQKYNNVAVRHYNSKLLKAYENARNSYKAACYRYDMLIKAYKILNNFKTQSPIDEVDGICETKQDVPHTANIMKRMIEDAHREKRIIADLASECIRHLRSLRYEM